MLLFPTDIPTRIVEGGGRRRRLLRINCTCLDDASASTFYNREEEMRMLNSTLSPTVEGTPGKLLLLLGPKDSGKTALIREFRRRQKQGTCRGVSGYVDLRQGWEADELAANLSQTLLDSFSGRFTAAGFASADVWLKANPGDSDVSLRFLGIRGALAEVEEYACNWKSMFRLVNRGYHYGFPTIFIDEANLLSNWTNSKAGAENLEVLLAGLVRISKQECSANVVMASSDSFFRGWLTTRPALRGSRLLSYGTVGHFNKQEARGFLETVLQPCAKLELEEIWEDVFGYVGGSVMVLWEVVELFNTAAEEGRPILGVWREWKEDKLTGAVSFLMSGETLESPDPPDPTRSPPRWTQEEWKKAMQLMAQAPDGVVPYASLIKEISKAAVNSLIEHGLLNYRLWTGWDTKDVTVERKSWPIVMPYNKQDHVAMCEIVAGRW